MHPDPLRRENSEDPDIHALSRYAWPGASTPKIANLFYRVT
jgi:hypothetical protein